MLEIEGAIRKGVDEVTPHVMLHREVFFAPCRLPLVR
jgi:hypothetical protein